MANKFLDDNNESTNFTLKLILLGNSMVGKSNILLRYTKKDFKFQMPTTAGIEFARTRIYLPKKKQHLQLQIWDTAGQERYKGITKTYYKNAIGALLVFDITDRQSYISIESWLRDLGKEIFYLNAQIDSNGDENIVKLLMGNKSDLESKRVVTTDEALEFAKQNNIGYIETSALNGSNIDFAFENLTEEIFNLLTDNDDQSEAGDFKSSIRNSNIFNKSILQSTHSPIQGATSKLDTRETKSKNNKDKDSCC